jgi:hypothetical protein
MESFILEGEMRTDEWNKKWDGGRSRSGGLGGKTGSRWCRQRFKVASGWKKPAMIMCIVGCRSNGEALDSQPICSKRNEIRHTVQCDVMHSTTISPSKGTIIYRSNMLLQKRPTPGHKLRAKC